MISFSLVRFFQQPIERFYARSQHLYKFIETKESVCIRKEFNSHRIGLGHQRGCRFIVLGHQYGRREVMCKQSIGSWFIFNPLNPESDRHQFSPNNSNA